MDPDNAIQMQSSIVNAVLANAVEAWRRFNHYSGVIKFGSLQYNTPSQYKALLNASIPEPHECESEFSQKLRLLAQQDRQATAMWFCNVAVALFYYHRIELYLQNILCSQAKNHFVARSCKEGCPPRRAKHRSYELNFADGCYQSSRHIKTPTQRATLSKRNTS